MKKYLLILFTISLVLVSCKKEDELVVPVENVNPPENNNEILGQKIIPSNTYSSIYNMLPATIYADEQNFIFYGTETPDGNGRSYVLKKVNVETGNISWSTKLDMNVYYMLNFVNLNSYQDGDIYILFGGKDIDGNGSVEYGVITTVDKNGKIIDTKSNIDNDYTTCFYNAHTIAECDANTYVVLGRAKKDKISYPLAKIYSVDATGKIFETKICPVDFNRKYIDLNQPNKYYYKGNGTDVYLLDGDGVNSDKSYLQRINITKDESPRWETEIKADIYDFTQDGNGGYYVCGQIKDENSSQTSNGGYWSDGIVCKYNSTGGLQWKQVVRSKNVSSNLNYDDEFLNIMYNPMNDCIYSVGSSSAYYKDSKYHLGNALVTKLNVNNGSILYNYSLGNKSYASSFNYVGLCKDKIVCGGYTKWIDATSGFQNWIVKINQ